ncbi:MAG: tRNA anti-like [Verrucomicrobiota bacterium]|jgi:hypothetical protein
MNVAVHRLLGLAVVLLGAHPTIANEETVTVSKVRLQELERKEAELEKIKEALRKAEQEIAEWKKLSPPAQPSLQQRVELIREQKAELESLAPLKAGELVNATDLFKHYRADSAAAAKRYAQQKITVRGTIVGFEKPMFSRPYLVLLQTDEPMGRVACKFELPEKFNSAYTVKNGVELVAESGGHSRTTLAKVGEVITLQATCKGQRDGNILLVGCERK